MSTPPTQASRRLLLQSAAGLALARMTGTSLAAEAPEAYAVPSTPTPGKPGDFDFLAGHWNIQHRRLKGREWDEFKGEATCWTILGGVGSVEELRIPARDFSGLGLRLLDVQAAQWRDVWVNARSGLMSAPGMPGSFENGVGIFIADDEDGGQPIKVRGVWDRISKTTCRWHQAVSRDGGKHWEVGWWMDWTRV